MRYLSTLATLGLTLALAEARPGNPSKFVDPTERIPNTIPNNAFPRWLSYVSPDSQLTALPGSNPIVQGTMSFPSLAVDSRNVAHVVGRILNEPAGILFPSIGYVNNKYETRRSNGFSAPFILATNFQVGDKAHIMDRPDIWVASDDTLHVVWQRSIKDVPSNVVETADIFYARKTATGWDTTVNLTAGDPNPHLYTSPQVQVVPLGPGHAVHVVAVGASPLLVDSAAAHVFYDGAISTIEAIPGVDITDVVEPLRLTLDAGNQPWVVWTEGTAPHSVYYNSKATGTWGPALPVAAGPTDDNIGADISLQQPGNLPHFAWIRKGFDAGSPADKVFYIRPGEGESQVSQVIPPGGSQFIQALIVVDSRQQIHVVWDGLSYGARVKNPLPDTVSPTWRVQERAVVPIHAPDGNPTDVVLNHLREVAINANDQIHLVGGERALYTRTMDYTLGDQDDAGMLTAFPGARINVTNGNLLYHLGLFSTAGTGPTQAFSLTYNSLEFGAGLLAQGWKLNYEIYLEDVPKLVSSDGEPCAHS